jgi:ectoine hydroxylase-related dioxygenase (phytanoyl-CoA dioxygenase family)
MKYFLKKEEYARKGYTVIQDVFTCQEIDTIIHIINSADSTNSTFRKTNDLFAIRQFLKEMPKLQPFLLKKEVTSLIKEMFDEEYFPVKSIYFDKPGNSNWFVSYHQDLTISVNTKAEIEGFGPWTVKHNQFAVQPPVDILQNNFTIRIHLDDTDENNGALRVIPGSHKKGVYRAETIDWKNETEDICKVNKGGIMIMSPLLLHASGRSTNNQKRRVAHIEFSKCELPKPLLWSEGIKIGNQLSS